MTRVSRQALREADLTFTWKLVTRICSILLAAIAIGLIGWAQLHAAAPVYGSTVYNPDGYGYSYGPTYEDSEDGNVLIPWEHISLGLSILWNLANIGVWFTPSRAGRGMHPGANVGCDLILWLILLLTGFFASFAANDYLSPWNQFDLDNYDAERLSNGTFVSFAPNGTEVVDPSDCPPFASCGAAADYNYQLKHEGVVIAVGVTFTFIVMLLHFALFISACRYTHARRHEKGGRYAKAVTEEATTIATKMVRDMGYPSPVQWPGQPHPQTQWMPQGEQFTAAPLVQPYSQPKSEADTAERGLHDRYSQQVIETQRGESQSKGKEREDELGFDHGTTALNHGSSQQYSPTIRIDSPGAVENGDGGIVR